ncbi:sulfatase-like hydrolase/transferase [Szabonella alba]|uniref:Sulfatase-like hydrolase/transferase n=1 Tax=Szabonella alba TaxID=2804194 RepID=A0A8K0Y2A2_9RHOB|nr:sulfatase-like hydrolase/transferase [Szabonella alba]MBL4919248.1 sulfatase-like hydrolase/transferase [Szabonella alba]
MRAFLRHPALRLGLAAVLLHLLLILPNHLGALTPRALLLLPLELPVLLLALLAAGPGRIGLLIRVAITATLVPVVILKVANLAMFSALSRPFNLISDISLIEAGLHLLAGSVGGFAAGLVAVAAVAATGLILIGVWWATGIWAGAWSGMGLRSGALRLLMASATLVFSAVAALDVAQAKRLTTLKIDLPGTAFSARVGLEQVQLMRATLAELAAFRIAARIDPFADLPALLDLIDRDVIVVFVESYGRTSLDTPQFADLHRATLSRGEERLAQAGLAMASGILGSPTRGGQSWLAHSTFANGLWIADQTRYRASLVSGRQTLFHLAARSGFHTAAVMPQITMPWPESAALGFDTILAAADLGYRGKPFNWVTMPDQFTFAALDRLLRDQPDTASGGKRHFIQIATGTSHAPWVPVPRLVPWQDIGDGTIFNAMAAEGDPPDVVWRDNDRVRAQYRLAIDYALQTVLAYAELHADDPPLIIVLGDHQAAEFVALDSRAEVPVHVIGPADLVARAEAFAATPGLIPAPDAPVIPMNQLRDLVLQAYSSALPVMDGG